MAQLLRLSRGATAGSARLPCPLFPTRRPRRSAIFMAAPLRGKGPQRWDVPQQRQTGLHRSTSRQNQRATSTGFVSPSSSHGQPHLPTFPAEVGRWLLSLEGLRGLLADIDGENQAPNNQDIDGGKNATSTTHLTPTQRAEQALSAVQKLLESAVCQSPWLIHPNNNGRHTVATRTEVKKRRVAVMPLAVSQPPSDADSALVERCTDALALLRTEVLDYVWRVKASTCMPMEQIADDFHWPKEAEAHIMTYTHLMPSLAALPGSRINLESEVSLRHMIGFSHAATDRPMSVAVARDADRYLSTTAGSDSKLQSSLPWLVARLSQPLEQRQPGTASAGVVTEDEWLRWMTAAADALCAATPESILRRGWMTEADSERSSSPSSSSPFAVLMPVLCEDEEVPVTRIDRTGTGQAASSTEAADLWLRERTGGCLDTHSCAVQPFWLLVLEELRAWWWESLEHLSAAKAHTLKSSLKSRSKKQSPTSSLEFRAVGALLSFRRMVSAMGTKNLLGPIFVLHNLIMGSPNGPESEVTAHRWMTRVMEGHFGSLLLREGMLLQAAMLSSMGHSCERSVDLPRGASASFSPLVADLLRQLSTLQQRCVALVGLLSQQIERSLSDEMVSSVLRQALSGLTPRTAENARAKLQEGLRLSVKLSLRCGDTHSVCSLHAACQSMGGSWEVGRALLHEGHTTEAVEAFRAFFDQTARQFPHTLPPSIRRQALEALSAAALEHTVTGAHPHAEVVTTADLMDAARHASKTLGKLVEQGYGPLPRAVRLDAILHFIFSVEVLQREDINRAIATYLAGCMTVHEYCLTYAATEGLDVKVAEKLGEGFLCLRQRSSMSLSQANIPNAVLNQCFTLTVTTMMLHYPYIPVCRVVLTRLLRAGAHDAVLETLRLLAGGHMTGTYVRALLRSLPLIALQGLEPVASGLQSTTINEDGGKVDVARTVELQELRDGLQMALRSRTEVEAQKQPWACPLCSTWNNRFAHSCKLCGSRSLAVIQCQRCHGFGSTEHQSCPICEAPWWKHPEGDDASRSLSFRGSNGGEALLLDREKVLAVLPMRRWTCTPCRHDNTAESLFYCAVCSAPSPTAAACQLHEVQCKECGARCPKGMLRPWCSRCGCLFGDVAASAGKRARLWWCLSCHRMNPWLLSHCDGCDNPRWYSSMSTLSSDDADGGVPGDSAADYRTVLQPVVEVPWRTMRCLKCRQHNPLGSCVCRSCGHPLAALPQDVRGRVEGALTTWRAGVLRREKESIAGVEMAWHSMSTQHVGGDSPPTQTKLEQPPASLWVCLHDGCLHVNQTPQTTTDDPLACSACGHCCSADSVAVMTQHNPVVPEFLLRHGSQATPSAVLLSMDAGELERCEDATQRTRCPHCGSSYPPDGVEAFSACAGCGSLSQRCAPQSVLAPSAGSERGSDGFNILRSILVLNTMQRSLTLHASTAGGGASSQSPTWLLTHVTTGIEVLASLPPHCVPWKAAKLQHPHSAVEQIQMLLRGIQTVASLGAPSSLNEAASLHGDEQEKQWLSHVRPWALAGLRLVELVNATTEMDVMGFDALAHLCLLIRPWAREEIYSHTRRTYLLRRRLSREAIAGGLLCPTCLHAHSLDDPCPH